MRCPGCRENKVEEDFHRGHGFPVNPYCSDCEERFARTSGTADRPATAKTSTDAVRAWITRTYGSYRNYKLVQKYGITEAQFEEIKHAQGGVCAVCRKRPATQVDHDHKTGKVRAILCLRCNAGLGAFRDDPRLLWEAVDYLMERTPGGELRNFAR